MAAEATLAPSIGIAAIAATVVRPRDVKIVAFMVTSIEAEDTDATR
jgi:hypothetical protein